MLFALPKAARPAVRDIVDLLESALEVRAAVRKMESLLKRCSHHIWNDAVCCVIDVCL